MSRPWHEFEFEDEFEFELGARRRMRPPALMRYLGYAAARADSEDEAEAFIGALVPLAAQAVPRAAPALMRVAPQLIRGLSNAASSMRRNPNTRALVQHLPAVAQRTAASIARRTAQGQRVTPSAAMQSLTQQMNNVMGRARNRSMQIINNMRESEMAERMAGGWPRFAYRQRRPTPFNITPPRPATMRDQLRDARAQAIRGGGNFRRATEILRGANLPYDPTLIDQDPIR